MPLNTTCIGKTMAGTPCGGSAMPNGFCRAHQDQAGENIERAELDTDFEIAKKRRDKHRADRAKLGAYANQKLVAPKREGYVRRWVNHDGTRVDDLKDKGYTFVKPSASGDENITSTDLGSDRKSQIVGKKADGSALTAYLMERPEQWHLEESQEKETARQKLEASIKRGQVAEGSGPVDQDRLYDPSPGNNLLRPG